MKFKLLILLCLTMVLKITSCGYDDWYPCQGHEFDIYFGDIKFPFKDQNNMVYKVVSKNNEITYFNINKTVFTPFIFKGGDCHQKIEAFYYEMQDTTKDFKMTYMVYAGNLEFDEYYEDNRTSLTLKLFINNAHVVTYEEETYRNILTFKNFQFTNDSGCTQYADSNLVLKRIQ